MAKLHGSSNYNIRILGASVLRRINTEAGTAALIDFVNDQDSDARQAANDSLNGRSFSENHVESLGKLFDSSNYNVRVSAARFLGTTSSRRALEILEARLQVESDSDVKAEITKSIEHVKKRIG